MARVITFLLGVLLLGSVQAATQVYTTYYHNDHLGSPVAATDERNELLWRAHYRPYGERQENPGDISFGSPGYTGHVQDSTSGLVYMQARYYDPQLGRFLSMDPLGPQEEVPGSFNRYAYGLNNPYRFVDRDGLWAEDAVIGVASVSMGAYSLGQNVSDGNWSAAAVDAGGLVLDGVAMAVPVVPAAAGLAIQASRAGNKANKSAVGLETRGYRPQPGERTIQGQVDSATQSGNPTVQRGSQDLFRLRSSGHGQSGASTTPQNVRNTTPEGRVFTGKGPDRPVTPRDIRELYKAQTEQGTNTLRTRSGR